MWESFKASASQWDSTRILDRINRPDFENGQKVGNVEEYIDQTGLVLDESEYNYILELGAENNNNKEALDYGINYVKDQQKAREISGDNPVTAFVAAFVDPLYLALPPGVKIGRTASAALMGVTTTALPNSVEGVISDEEMLRRILLNAGLGAAYGKASKVGGASVIKEGPKELDANSIDNAMTPMHPPENLAARVGDKIQLNIHKEIS